MEYIKRKPNAFISACSKRPYIFFMLPAVVFLLTLVIFPLIYSLWISFHEWTILTREAPPLIGFANYGQVFKDTRFWGGLYRTGLIAFFALSIELILGYIIGSILSRDDLRGIKFFRVLIFLPVLVNPVVTGFTFRLMFTPAGSPINHIISVISGQNIQINWLGKGIPALAAVIAADVWQWTPFVAIIVMASLMGLPKEPFEAARLDRATPMQIFSKITLPGVKTSLAIIVLLRIIELFKLFDYILVMTGGGPGVSTETISIYAYLTGYSFFSMGYAAAISYILLILLIILATVFIRSVGKEVIS